MFSKQEKITKEKENTEANIFRFQSIISLTKKIGGFTKTKIMSMYDIEVHRDINIKGIFSVCVCVRKSV